MPPGRPTIRSRQVAGELRRLRKQAGFTTGEVGARLGLSQAKVSRVETGSSGLRLGDVQAMLGLYRVPEPRQAEILDLVRRAAEPGWLQVHGRGLPEQWQTLIDWESKAVALRVLHAHLVPDLLQTADYARAAIRGTAPEPPGDAELDVKVGARLARQGILSREHPPALHVLIGEQALRIPVGGPAIAAAQLRHLAEVIRRPHVEIRVVPDAVGAHPGLDGAFLLMDFEQGRALVHTEHRSRSLFLDDEESVLTHRRVWQRVDGIALSAAASAEMISALAEAPGVGVGSG
ncbi:helix-turn-helix domain-containing protein [Actinokineospora globicatena]|uniref:Transcriptional regulator n=1 Tax=Actinokineospora globicatena TaxID=103729 RepID=A0A9W6QQK9_9PSEU|nr:helix-turn-helix transcriptional regulator [Actinokineospora globicatena]MCP2300659.1 Helix-turn-helix domain-containing protein [Actinokineospora globicatena]GLW81203.1 transcriptional regulator [Actinokineospora globicatena]GLW88396.1 transcriptional regulator [Actinokineospora globicatena]GLW92864.1 transcriptional regulator [Actinokineospora globicatena]